MLLPKYETDSIEIKLKMFCFRPEVGKFLKRMKKKKQLEQTYCSTIEQNSIGMIKLRLFYFLEQFHRMKRHQAFLKRHIFLYEYLTKTQFILEGITCRFYLFTQPPPTKSERRTQDVITFTLPNIPPYLVVNHGPGTGGNQPAGPL